MPTIEEVVSKYVQLRDRKKQIAEQQAEALRPINEAMENIENYILHQMNTLKVVNLKTAAGTAYKSTATSCSMQDPVAFKEFVFKPVSDGILNYLRSSGHDIQPVDAATLANIIRDLPMWDMIDFRAGKKGITEYIENKNQPVPGVDVKTEFVINIRRS